MPSAALLLTGGSSRRMGRDKGSLALDPGTTETLAQRTGRLLVEVADPAWEIGGGISHLPARREDPPGGGPLAAVAAGASLLAALGWEGAVLVCATDLPFLDLGFLRWLVDHPFPGTIIPVAGGRPQPLCARYAPADVARSVELVAAGHRAMLALVKQAEAKFVGPQDWADAAGHPDHLADVDTPADLLRLGLPGRVPGFSPTAGRSMPAGLSGPG